MRKTIFFLLLALFLCGCQMGSYEIRELSKDEALIKAVQENPAKYEGKEIELNGMLETTKDIEWVTVSGYRPIHVRKAVEKQTFEYETNYTIKGLVRHDKTPFSRKEVYIEATQPLKKTEV